VPAVGDAAVFAAGNAAPRPVNCAGRVRVCVPAAAWHAAQVTDIDHREPDPATAGPVEPTGWLTLPDIAELLDLPVNRVHQLIRERTMLAVRRNGVLRVPAEFMATPTVRKHLPGVLNLLHDAGYNDEEALRWLVHPRPDAARYPAAALAGERAIEVKRRAQALGF